MKNILSNRVKNEGNTWLIPGKLLYTILFMLLFGVGQAWGDNGYWNEGTWKIYVWPGSGSDTWSATYNKGATAPWGIITASSYYVKGVGVNTWGSGVTSTELWWSLNGKTYGGTIGTGNTSGNQYWEKTNLTDVDIIANAANNPGNNTITCYFKLNGSDNFTSYITYTIPGFTTSSTSKNFGDVTISSNSSQTISFTQHYGTALTTSDCKITGTNKSEFSVTSISETGVTVKFTPNTTGSKSATLTITDAHTKTCTITLSGTGTAPAEATHSVTVSYICTSPSATVSTATTPIIGEETYSSQTAPVVEGFTFVNWTLGTGLSKHASDALTSNPIRVITNSSGSGYTLRANYTEVLTTDWKLIGDNQTGSPFGDNYTYASGKAMSKKSGHSTESNAYKTIDVTTLPADYYGFKVATANNDDNKWGYGTSDGYYIEFNRTASNTQKQVYNGSQHELKFIPDALGEYEFRVEYPGNKYVYVTFPTAYAVNFSRGTVDGADGTVTAEYSSVAFATGTKVQSGKSVTFKAPDAKTGYTWQGWYTVNNGSGSTDRVSEDQNYTTSISEATTLYACYTQDDYTITLNGNEGTGHTASVTAHYDEYAPVDDGEGGHKFSITNPERSGYTFAGWYTNSDGTGTMLISPDGYLTWNIDGFTDASGKWIATTGTNLYARWKTNASVNAYNFQYGSGTYYSSSWTLLNFGDADDHKRTVDWTLINPASQKFYVGYNGDFQADAINGSGKSSEENLSDLRLAPGTLSVGTATGAVGKLVIFDNSTADNLYVGFQPNGYGLTYAGGTKAFSEVSDNMWQTDIVTLTAADVAGTFKVGLATASSYVDCSTMTATDNATALNTRKDALVSEQSYPAIPDLAAGQEGRFVIWDNDSHAGEQWYLSFLPVYSITYNANGAETGSVPTDANKYRTNETPAVLGNSGNLAKQGYAFSGWNTAADGKGTPYAAGDNLAKIGSNVTLYAQFEKAQITNLALDAAVVAPGGSVGVTPTVAPTPAGTNSICWKLLYSNGNLYDPQPTFSPASPAGISNKVTFNAPTTSGTYLIAAVLRTGNDCDGGTELSTRTASFQVAGDHTVTIQYKCGSEVIAPSTTTTGRPLTWSDEITPAEIFGYTFEKWVAGDGVTMTIDGGETTIATGGETTGKATTHAVQIKATYDGKLTAKYTQNNIIYFKNTLGWSDVYVNLYPNAWWNDPKGAGNETLADDKRNKHMTRIGETDIWYYDYGNTATTAYVSFTNTSQDNYRYFSNAKVVYPANYQDDIHTDKSAENGFKAATPMFVPIAGQTKTTLNTNAEYYNRGYWVQYTPGTGYTLEIYNSDGNTLLKSVAFTSDGDLMPMEATVDLEAGQTYKYQLRRGGEGSAGVYYGNSGTMTYSNCTGWEMINQPSLSKAGITANAAGDYKFTLSYAENNSNQYRLRMTVKYPVSMGDFRIVYSDNDTWSRGVAHTLGTWIMKSHTITARANGVDIVSFFISKDHSPEIRWEKATGQSGTSVTWGTTGSWLTTGYTDVSESGVYNFKVTQNEDGTAISSIERIGKYTGDYYIRVDCANSKWDNYTVDPDHRMTYSEYSITHGGYSHYYCHWVTTDERKNVKFCIANDYSPSISDTLTREVASGDWANITNHIDASGNILTNANVRFMWNQSTNKISRAYVDGAQGTGSNNFLYMLSVDGKIRKADGSALDNNKVAFTDNENWLYEANIQTQPEAEIKLLSNWGTSNTITQYFKGTSSTTEKLIEGSGTSWYNIRLLYDFKTNRLVAAYMPSGEVSAELEINADVMFIREHQGDIAQLTLTGSGAIKKIETAYGVMRFNKWTLNNKEKTGSHSPLASPASYYERALYWVSFPFRVKLSEVFGFGTYGTHWILQYYDGAERAEKGLWQETGSYWKFVWDRKDFVLEPNTGYLLTLEPDLMGEDATDVWGPESRSSQVELYFPSYGTMPDITKNNVVHTLAPYTCTINRSGGNLPGGNDYRTTYDRRIVDSHWHVMGVPTYVNTDDITFAQTTWTDSIGPNFLYIWNADDNTITAASASDFEYHAMHAYMVQYHGTVTWAAQSGSQYSPIVARRTYSGKPKEVEFCIEIQQNEKMMDRTFINLSNDETVSAGFAFNEDMTKEFSGNKPSIYTFIDGDVVAAGNTMPMSEQTTIVPLGIETKQAGDYTIAIPEGTDGIGVTLIDEETGVRTSLSALDYTINLPAGKHDNRFFLEISPIKNTPTDIENEEIVNRKSSNRKLLIDGILYIVKDGKMYDARGTRVE